MIRKKLISSGKNSTTSNWLMQEKLVLKIKNFLKSKANYSIYSKENSEKDGQE